MNASISNSTAISEMSKMRPNCKVWRLMTPSSRETSWTTVPQTSLQDHGVYKRMELEILLSSETMFGKDTQLSIKLDLKLMVLSM